MSGFLRLSRSAMLGLADGIKAGRVSTKLPLTGLRNYVPDHLVELIQAELRGLLAVNMTAAQIAVTLRLLAAERAASQAISDRVELVWSGTKVVSGGSRDTAVVAQELFQAARHSVLISSFSVDHGAKAEALFGVLASRMDMEPDLEVRFFLNVKRPHKDTTTADSEILRVFAEEFRKQLWPGERLPAVYYDPRAFSVDMHEKACLHAKCIVIDDARALVTSANFSEAAHARNIEAGTVISDTVLAKALKAQFDTLVDHGALKRVPGL